MSVYLFCVGFYLAVVASATLIGGAKRARDAADVAIVAILFCIEVGLSIAGFSLFFLR